MAHHKKRKSRKSRKSRGVAKSSLRSIRKAVTKTNSLLKKVARHSRKSR